MGPYLSVRAAAWLETNKRNTDGEKKREQNKQQATLGGKQASESSLLPESWSQKERQGAQRERFC